MRNDDKIMGSILVLVLCIVANAWFGYQFWVAMPPALPALPIKICPFPPVAG